MITGLVLLLGGLGPLPAVAGPAGHRLDGAPVALRAEVQGPAEVLVGGGCLLRLGRGARAHLARPAAGQRCATVHALAGPLRLLVPAGTGATVRVAGTPVTVLAGDALVSVVGAAGSVCLRQGQASAPGLVAPGAPGGEAGAALPALISAAAGQCLPLRAGAAGPAVPAADRPGLAPDLEAPVPALPLPGVRLDLAALARPTGKGRGHTGSRGGADVEAGSQSMCLETGSEGSAADPTGSSGTEVVKPLPPARLRVTVTLERR